MSIEVNSFSSALTLGTTLYRNRPGVTNLLVAQVVYPLIAAVALAEAVAALVFSTLSLLVYPISSFPFRLSVTYLDSSAFCLGWSITDFFLNPFLGRLIADEKSARQILQSGNLLAIPRGAIV